MNRGAIEATRRSYRRPMAWLVCILLLAGSAPVAPAIIPVGGACDLGEAIENANGDLAVNPDCVAGSGADTIQLSGNVTLTSMDNSTDGDNGLPSITSEITIDGAGNTIARDAGAPSFRIFHVASGGDLMLNDVAVSGGRLEGVDASGGGVFNRGDFALTNSTLSGNSIDSSNYGYGAGIYNLGVSVIFSSTVSGNQIQADVAYGGGIFTDIGATLNVELSEISGNSVAAPKAGGGGVETWGTTTITQSTVSGNSGEAIGPYSDLKGVGVRLSAGGLTFSASTVSGNVGSSDAAGYGALLFGGGISVDDGIVNVSASTISSNSLTALSAFSAALGGGLHHGRNPGTISYSTLSGNSVSAGFQQDGGAIYVGTAVGDLLNVIATLIADSTGGNCDGVGTINDIQNNLADDASCATIPATLTGLDPMLLDNGGPTRTHALLEGGNAIGLAGTCGIPFDQRGVERDDGACDSGSFELNECMAPDGNQAIAEGTFSGPFEIEVCHSITTGEGLIVSPGGDLTLRAGSLVTLGEGTVIEQGGELTIEIDPALNM